MAEEDILTPDVRFHLIRKMERHKVIALAGPELLQHERKYLEFHDVAGVILFRRNIANLAQVSELIGGVRDQLSDGPPPLIMADHEGDFVAELRAIIGAPPSALAIAATGDLDLARDVARDTGRAMFKLGLNTVLAPVADCYLDQGSPITGLRTFGRDPEKIAEFVAASIEGFHEGGVLCCAKHFPGHGDTPEDSHETLPEIKRTADELMSRDVVPFQAAVDAGVDMMMTSHIAFPMGRDELIPASFDPVLIKGTLRKQMKFDGVVITDALEMAGARWYAGNRFGGVAGGFERALLAGSDLLLHTRPIPEQVQVEGESDPVLSINVMDTIIKTLEKVVDRSRVDEKLHAAAEDNEALGNILDILATSYDRVMSMRNRLQVAEPPARKGAKVIELDAYPTVPTVYRDVAERSIASVGPWDGADYGNRSLVVMPISWTATESLSQQDIGAFVSAMIKPFPRWERTGVVSEFAADSGGAISPTFETSNAPRVIDAAHWNGEAPPITFELSGDEELAIVFSSRGVPPEDFMAQLQSFAELHDPVVVISIGWPVHDWVPRDTPVLVTLGASPQAAAATTRILGGALAPAGDLSGLFP